MGIIENAKEVADLIQKIGDIELYRKIVTLEGQIIDLTREKRNLEAKVESLSGTLAFQQKLVFKKPLYYAEGDQVPYCSLCWESKKEAIHLVGPSRDNSYECKNCNKFYHLNLIR